MGYTIPPPDYTLPPMQINVGQEIGKTFGAALAQYGRMKRQERKDAEKLKQTQNAFKNQLLLQQNELKTGFFKNLETAGYSDDPEKENELFDQFKQQIDVRAKEALKARMAMEFDIDLSDEDRTKYAQTVTDFQNYSKSSLDQMGGIIADADDIHNMDMVVVGDPTNGEQLSNLISLQNIKGTSANVFGQGSITSRTLNTQGNSNIINSTVKIPTDSNYWKSVNTQTEGGADAILQNAIAAGNVKIETVGDKDYYVFKQDINVSNYSKEGGMDLVQQKLKPQDAIQVLEENKFINERGAFSDQYISQEPVITTEVEKDSKGKKTGYQKTVDFNIIDVESMTANKAYTKEMGAEYSKIFENPNVSLAQRQAYLTDIGSMTSAKALASMDKEAAKKLVMKSMTDNMWGNFFPESYGSTGSKPQQIQMQLGEPGQKIEELSEQQQLLLKSAEAQGLKNPTTGELYQPGDSIYVIRQERSRVLSTSTGNGKSKTESQEYFSNISEQLSKGNIDLFTSITPTPGGKTFYKKFGDEIWEVDKDGEKVGSNPTPIQLVQSVYTNYSN